MSSVILLDTNVILHDPKALNSFEKSKVILPISVIEELDNFKKDSSELGRNARFAIRMIDSLRSNGSLKDGVVLENGGILQIVTDPKEQVDILFKSTTDNSIINTAYFFMKQGHEVTFISKDINARVKADAIGLKVDDYDRSRINVDDVYQGWRKENISEETFNQVAKQSEFSLPDIKAVANEYISFHNESNKRNAFLARFDLKQQKYIRVKEGKIDIWGIRPKSIQQRIAIDLLLNPNINLITIVGQAGTGKTLLAIAAGLQQVITENRFNRWVITRPIMPLGKDIGYLPGKKNEKLSHWMEPIFDNLDFILDMNSYGTKTQVYSMIKDGQIEMEALTYIRGRSLSKKYVIVDEVQNLTPHEIKTVISRVGEHTKIVLTGDPYQIDNPYLDSCSNGLTYTVERMKDFELHGHITLDKSERSPLAAAAVERL